MLEKSKEAIACWRVVVFRRIVLKKENHHRLVYTNDLYVGRGMTLKLSVWWGSWVNFRRITRKKAADIDMKKDHGGGERQCLGGKAEYIRRIGKKRNLGGIFKKNKSPGTDCWGWKEEQKVGGKSGGQVEVVRGHGESQE